MDKIIVETFREGGKVCVNYVEIDGIKYHPSYASLVSLGFRPVSSSLFRGYVSRKIKSWECLANVAGGKRAGQIYVELPNWKSTRYSIRLYFTAPVPLEFREYQDQ